jgi:mRNA interferase RelE/StbE
MAWKVKFDDQAAKALKAFDTPIKKRIEQFIDHLVENDAPRATGRALQGSLKGLWRYRVGYYRLICQIKDNELIILVVEIGNRKDIYR